MEVEIRLNPENLKHLLSIKKMEIKDSYYIYFLFRDTEIVYIGYSKNIDSAIAKHYKNDNMKFDSHAEIKIKDKEIDELFDRVALNILVYNPIYNSGIPSSCKYFKSLDQIKKKFRKNKTELKKHVKENNLKYVGVINGISYFDIREFYTFNYIKNY